MQINNGSQINTPGKKSDNLTILSDKKRHLSSSKTVFNHR